MSSGSPRERGRSRSRSGESVVLVCSPEGVRARLVAAADFRPLAPASTVKNCGCGDGSEPVFTLMLKMLLHRDEAGAIAGARARRCRAWGARASGARAVWERPAARARARAGTDGRSVCELEQRTRTRVSLGRSLFPGTRRRVLVISGTEESVLDVVEAVLTTIVRGARRRARRSN